MLGNRAPEVAQSQSFVGKGGWVAVACVIGNHTVPAIATGQETIGAPKPTGLQCLAQPQRALHHQCMGCCSKPVQTCGAAPEDLVRNTGCAQAHEAA